MDNIIIYVPVLIIVLLDFITGGVKGLQNHDFNSRAIWRGLIHKSTYIAIFVLICALQLESQYLDLPFDDLGNLHYVAIGLILYVETISILENCAEIYPELKSTGLLKLFRVGGKPLLTKEDKKDTINK